MRRLVEVTQYVSVTIDETKFTPEFMEEFRQHFYSFDTLDEHIEHLAQLHARGLADSWSQFIEGYGKPSDMGIRFESRTMEATVIETVS